MSVLPKGKICLVTSEYNGPWKNGGIGTAFRYLAEFLEQEGHEVTVVFASLFLSPDEPVLHEWKESLKAQNITFVPLLAEMHKSHFVPGNNVEMGYLVYQWLKDKAFDVVHFHDFQGMGYHVLKAKHQGIAFQHASICVQLHGSTSWTYPQNQAFIDQIELAATVFQERESIKLADCVVSPSQYMLDWCRDQQGWDLPEQSLKLPNLYEETHSRKTFQVHELIQEIVFFGRLEIRKGLEFFCRALEMLPKNLLEGKTITFLGKLGRCYDMSSEEAIRTWLPNINYRIIPDFDQQAAIAYLKNSASLAVMPSMDENAPYTILECAMEGIPFITNHVGGIPEMIEERHQAQCLSQPNAKSLAVMLEKTLSEKSFQPETSINIADVKTRWSALHQSLITQARDADAILEKSDAQPLVSVCLIHYNRPHYLKQAIASLEQQDYPNFEVILIDDGSKEPEAIAYLDALEPSFKMKGWSIIRQENQYLGVARNNAARHAKGEYLKFMDDDNIAKPNEISRFVQVALSTKADIITCCVQPFSSANPEESKSNEVWIPFGADASLGALVNSFGDANALVKKSSFEALGGFTEDYGIGHEDWEFFAKAQLAGYRIELIPEVLFYYRVAPGSMQQITSTWQNLRRNIRPYLEHYPELSTLLQFSQGLFERSKAVEQENQSLQDQLSALQHALKVSQEENQQLQNSTSWKVTKPMRKVISSIKSS